MNEALRTIIQNGYFVHKPSKKGIGLILRGWDEETREPILGHSGGMIFPYAEMAREAAADMGEGWQIKRLRDVTEAQYEEMEALAAIYD